MVPAENEVCAEGLAGDEGGKEEEYEGGDVEDGLQDCDLRRDLEGLNLGEGAGPRRSSATRHGFVLPLIFLPGF